MAAPSVPDAKLWEGLRKEARKLENEIDERLSAYAKHGSTFGAVTSGGASKASETMSLLDMDQIAAARADEIEELLNHLSEINEGMGRCVANAGPASSASMMHMLQRHREILYDFSQEFKKTKANINMYREHAQLLNSVRDESKQFNQSASGMDSLLRERGAIGNVDRLTDGVLGQAMSTRDALASQREFLSHAYSRLAGVATRFPAINNIMGAINRKKKKDMIIIFSVIGACLLFLIIYSSRK